MLRAISSVPEDRLYTWLGFLAVAMGLFVVVPAYVLAVLLWRDPASVRTAVGGVATIVGTVVGFHFGHSSGAAGKSRAERQLAAIQHTALQLAAALDPATSREIVGG